MSQGLKYIPKVAIFLAGVSVGVLTRGSRRSGADPAELERVKEAVAGLESRFAGQESAASARIAQIEAQLQEHTARLADVPSTSQIIAGMEQLLSKTMSSLDERLTSQARSIEVLRTTVSQTDSLLERVLESLDSLQNGSETPQMSESPLLPRSAV